MQLSPDCCHCLQAIEAMSCRLAAVPQPGMQHAPRHSHLAQMQPRQPFLLLQARKTNIRQLQRMPALVHPTRVPHPGQRLLLFLLLQAGGVSMQQICSAACFGVQHVTLQRHDCPRQPSAASLLLQAGENACPPILQRSSTLKLLNGHSRLVSTSLFPVAERATLAQQSCSAALLWHADLWCPGHDCDPFSVTLLQAGED